MIHCPHLPTDSPLLLITSIRRIVRTMLLNIVIFIFFLTSLHVEANENICNFPLISCKCFNHSEEIVSPAFVGVRYGLRVECVNMTGVTLHRDIETIKERSKEKIYVLHVRDSNLAKLRGLPSGLVDLKHLTLDNTNIDLEQIRESSEILINLKSLRVFSETFTEIPEDFFSDLHGLNVLSLNNVSMRALSSDGLEFLEDSLKELSLTANKLRSIPPAVVRLPLLEVLDLSDNHIYTIPDDTASIMESGLRSLSRLDLNSELCCESDILSDNRVVLSSQNSDKLHMQLRFQ